MFVTAVVAVTIVAVAVAAVVAVVVCVAVAVVVGVAVGVVVGVAVGVGFAGVGDSAVSLPFLFQQPRSSPQRLN